MRAAVAETCHRCDGQLQGLVKVASHRSVFGHSEKHNATRDQRIATAFNRLHRQTNEGGSIDEEFRTEYVLDRVNTFGTSMLGLTLECARCHDHKFDPITQRDYFSLFAFFNNIDDITSAVNNLRPATASRKP